MENYCCNPPLNFTGGFSPRFGRLCRGKKNREPASIRCVRPTYCRARYRQMCLDMGYSSSDSSCVRTNVYIGKTSARFTVCMYRWYDMISNRKINLMNRHAFATLRKYVPWYADISSHSQEQERAGSIVLYLFIAVLKRPTTAVWSADLCWLQRSCYKY